jgi:DNA-binding NtrC family response regulator
MARREFRLAEQQHLCHIAAVMASATILVVDDDQNLRGTLAAALELAGHRVLQAGEVEAALDLCLEGVDLVLMDQQLPGAGGPALLRKVKEIDPDIVVIVMTAYSSVDQAVQAMKQGAFHYARKPFVLEEMMVLCEKGLETTRLKREMKVLRESLSAPYSFDQIIGQSAPMKEAKEVMSKVAASSAATVLLHGESGTGKDMAAKIIHFTSPRAQRLFMNVTCSALPETLLESELFGHERGAFTDAKKQKKGLLELADGGTVFLDEFSEMPPGLQVKLLHFLEEKAFRRVGGTVEIRVDVRVIAATNRDLDEAVQAGLLRKDLYYRLQVVPIRLPPLRERAGDIPLLADFFVDRFNREFKKKVRAISPQAVTLLEAHGWEGNVREFRNAFERAMLFHEGEELVPADFPLLLHHDPAAVQGIAFPPAGLRLDELVQALVVKAWQLAGGNQTRAAALLGITRDRMRYQVEKLGLT